MITKVREWGNSYGVTITKSMLGELGLTPGDILKSSIKNGAIVFSPAPKERKCPTLAEMIANIPKGGGHKLLRKGPPVGKEIW